MLIMMAAALELALMDSLALDPALLACPDDSGRLEPYGDELRCVECERHYCACQWRLGLLPRASLDAASPQGQRLASYRAGYSDRRDRPWLHGFRVLSADLGNAYLYRWARRAIEKFAAGRTLRILDAACAMRCCGGTSTAAINTLERISRRVHCPALFITTRRPTFAATSTTYLSCLRRSIWW